MTDFLYYLAIVPGALLILGVIVFFIGGLYYDDQFRTGILIILLPLGFVAIVYWACYGLEGLGYL